MYDVYHFSVENRLFPNRLFYRFSMNVVQCICRLKYGSNPEYPCSHLKGISFFQKTFLPSNCQRAEYFDDIWHVTSFFICVSHKKCHLLRVIAGGIYSHSGFELKFS